MLLQFFIVFILAVNTMKYNKDTAFHIKEVTMFLYFLKLYASMYVKGRSPKFTMVKLWVPQEKVGNHCFRGLSSN